ncbi:MAG: hypothetical protein RJA70_1073 [Pseudomonadota bacterium]|jgi:hypothetical protein
MTDGTPERTTGPDSLRYLKRLALAEFPDEEHHAQIEAYMRELAQLMFPAEGDSAIDRDRAQATCDATGDDEVTLLYKLERYLESVLVGRMVASGRRA